MTNQFWIAANIIFDLETGKTTQVLMLVNRESDATVFETQEEARNYFSFVKRRAQHIQWFLDEASPRAGQRVLPQPQGWVIRGIQTTQPQQPVG
jgi:hypothetical protein